MKAIYITFDNYYDVNNYNSFLTSAKNNNVILEEYIKIRSPYQRYIKINNKSDLPKFVNYDVATKGDVKFLVSVLKPIYPNEEYLLLRREGKDINYEEYIIPKELKKVINQDYLIVFKSMNFSEVSKLSKKLKETKIFKWGKAKTKKYNIYYCYNPLARSYISTKDILMEFGKEATFGLKHSKDIPNTASELEYYLNYYVLVKEKLEDKTIESEYWLNGKIKPLNKDILK